MYPWLEESFLQLGARAQNSSLHHALLIKGPVGIGKTDFSYQLAKSILCKSDTQKPCGKCQSCLLFDAQSHPDLHQVASEKQLGVDLIRDAIQKLSSKAHLSGNKVLIIEQAESMTESAANALLKTLEEPTENTFIFLVSAFPERLLPTIISRCEKVNLYAPSFTLCKQWLESQNIPGVNEDIIRIYGQCPLKIKEQLATKDGISFTDFANSIVQLRQAQVSSLTLAETWQKEAEQVVLWLQYELSKLAMTGLANNSLWALEDKLIKASIALQNPGVNRLLILSDMLTDFGSLMRQQTN
ncbi:DNA polymerase III subunit delta' [Aliiglaciecola sp. 3_MG-2023]|uniref:DNA polymerase III subunit delta' n=1 Tax=Aliiglaciecola sp. 3_MG-2023 TaxID=3062644 RepID=UPI0026E492BF|nr:DNA polymerase III subunit delta' [Aliiglaciecola sp. 3_MG-2023]MDO6692487.1 DNA polymerase III subunit delta' [Aliiglaciecola sp. 3_MG-2023]